MSFLAPLALAGLALLAAPILIHLFRPRKTARIPFSSLRWLKESSQEVSRRIEWHHWLLFLLRAGLLALLVLALARPFFLGADTSPPRDRIVVVDQSRSMDYQAADQPTPWRQATGLALAVARGARPGDRTAILAIDCRPRIVAPLSADGSPAAQALRESSPSQADTRLGGVLPVVEAITASEADRSRPLELLLLSDFHQGSLRPAEVQRFAAQFDRPLRVRLVSLGVSGENGWIAGARLLPPSDRGESRLQVELGAAGSKPLSRTLRIVAPQGTGEAELETASPVAVQIVPGRPTVVSLPLPSGQTLLGGIGRLRLDPPDALTSDDHYDFVAQPAAPLQILLIEPGQLGLDGRPAGMHLRAAFESLEISGRQSLVVTTRTPATLTAADLEAAEIVVAASLPQLAPPLLEKLTDRVRQGLGLALFLGPEFPTDFPWNSWNDANRPEATLLTRRWQSPLAEPAEPALLAQVEWRHPLLAELGDPQFADLPRSQFTRYARAAPIAKAAASESILARFPDGTPALLESRCGEGRVVVVNTSANDSWSDLPRRRSFVPLVDRLLTFLARRTGVRTFFVGEPIVMPLQASFGADRPRLFSPEEKRIPLEIASRAGRPWLVIPPLETPGVYRLEPAAGAMAEPVRFAVQAGPGDRDLTAIEPQSLRSWWSPAVVEWLTADDAAAKFTQEEPAADGSPWLLLLAGLFLAAETLYGTWITPLRAADAAAGGNS